MKQITIEFKDITDAELQLFKRKLFAGDFVLKKDLEFNGVKCIPVDLSVKTDPWFTSIDSLGIRHASVASIHNVKISLVGDFHIDGTDNIGGLEHD
jgi:hypothetical protein